MLVFDHSVGPSASTLAVALGATWIEKHFTLDKTADGPDHKASDEPEEFSLMVSNIRSAEVALGVNLKVCQDEEQDMRRISRKSLCSSRKILQGQVITPSDIVAKRPGTGFDTWSVNQIIGKRALVDIEEDTLFCRVTFNESIIRWNWTTSSLLPKVDYKLSRSKKSNFSQYL